MYQLNSMEHIPAIQHKPDIKKMPTSEQNSPQFPENDTKILADKQIPAKKQKRGKQNFYDILQQLMADPNFRRYAEDYHATEFYRSLGKIQVKYEYIKALSKGNKKKVNIEEEENNSLRKMVCDKNIET